MRRRSAAKAMVLLLLRRRRDTMAVRVCPNAPRRPSVSFGTDDAPHVPRLQMRRFRYHCRRRKRRVRDRRPAAHQPGFRRAAAQLHLWSVESTLSITRCDATPLQRQGRTVSSECAQAPITSAAAPPRHVCSAASASEVRGSRWNGVPVSSATAHLLLRRPICRCLLRCTRPNIFRMHWIVDRRW